MRHVSTSIEVTASTAVVWDRIACYEHWPSWGVSIRSVEAPGSFVEQGARGRVTTIIGLTLPFEITAVDPGRRWSWSVAGIPATGHEVVALGADRTKVRFTAPWLFAPYLFVLRRALRVLQATIEHG